jgi:hypothetical protein
MYINDSEKGHFFPTRCINLIAINRTPKAKSIAQLTPLRTTVAYSQTKFFNA